jgi:WD40 repeat protein
MEKSNLTRIIIEYLNKKGLPEISQLLEKESKIKNESEIFRKIKNLIINKNFDEAIAEIEANYNQKEIKLTIPFIRINQIFDCILDEFSEPYSKDFLSQQKTLNLIRYVISKSNESEKYKMHKTLSNLACLLFIEKRDSLLEKMEQLCPIAYTKDSLFVYLSNILCHYNKSLLGKIQSKNLFSIISKVYTKQISECLYHNMDDTQARYSFFRDHSCPVNRVPYKVILTIDEHNEEVLNIVLSDNNQYFAVVLKSHAVMIYKICYEVRKKKAYLTCKKRNNYNNKKSKNSNRLYIKKNKAAENESNLMDITDENNSFMENNINNFNNGNKKRKACNAINSNISNLSSNNIELKSDKHLSGAYSNEIAKRKLNREINYCKENLDSDEEFLFTNKNNVEIEAFKVREQTPNSLACLNNINLGEVKTFSRSQNKSKKVEDFDKLFSNSRQELQSHRSSYDIESPCSDIFKNMINQESLNNTANRKNCRQINKIFSEGNLEKNNTANYNFSNNRINSSNTHGKNLNTILEKIEDVYDNSISKNFKKHSLTEDNSNLRISMNNNNKKSDDKVLNNLKIFQVSKILAHKDIITSISFSSNASKIITASKDKTIKIHEVKTGKNIVNISDIGHMVTSAQFHFNETQILSTSLDSKIHIYSILGVKLDSIPSLNINEMLISEKHNLIILSAPILRAILIYDIETKTEKNKIFINDTIINISLSKLDKGENLLINSSNLTPVISLWSLSSKECVRKYFGHRQERLTTKCCFGGFKEKFILCGSDNKEVFIWNRNKSLPVKVIKFHSAPVNAAVWPTNEKTDFLISVSDDHTVKVIGNENVGNCEFIQGKFFDDNLLGLGEGKQNTNSNNMIIDEEKEGILLILKVMILIIIFYVLLLSTVFFLAKENNNL